MADKPKQTKTDEIKPNQVKTTAIVSIPLQLVYARLDSFLNGGDALKASIKGGSHLEIETVTIETVTG